MTVHKITVYIPPNMFPTTWEAGRNCEICGVDMAERPAMPWVQHGGSIETFAGMPFSFTTMWEKRT